MSSSSQPHDAASSHPAVAAAPASRSAAAEGRTREDALIGCWISPGWSSSVQAPERPDWPGPGPSERTGHSGLVTVLVARDRGGSAAGVCFYISGPYDDGQRIIRKMRRGRATGTTTSCT